MLNDLFARRPFTRRRAAELLSQLEGLEKRQLLAVDLAVEFDQFGNVPASLVPGDRVALPIIVTNEGDDFVDGRVSIRYYLSKNTTFDADDVLMGEFANQRIQLSGSDFPNNSGDFVGTVTVPTVTPGDYFFLVRLIPGDGVTDRNQSNDVAASTDDLAFKWQFGNFDNRSNVKLTLTSADGVAVSFSLSGGGFGTVTRDTTNTDRFDVRIENSGASSTFILSAAGGDGTNRDTALIDDIEVLGSLRFLDAVNARLHGDVTVNGTAGYVRFASIVGPSTIDIRTAGVNTTVELGTVSNLVFTTLAGITSFKVTNWTDTDTAADRLNAPWIGSLTSTGNFQPSLRLTGRSGQTLATVDIGGTAAKGAWDIDGRGNNWRFFAVAADWSASIKNNLPTLTVNRIFRGTIAAKTFGNITTGGLNAAEILAGADLGSDARLGGTGDAADTFASGTLNSIRVNGKVVNSIVGAGLNPVDGIFRNGNDSLTTGRINSVVVTKTASANSRFLARRLTGPGEYRINNRVVNTATDARFRLDPGTPPTLTAISFDNNLLPTIIRFTLNDAQNIDVSSLGGDLRLTGPNGVDLILNYIVPGQLPGNGPSVMVEYAITPPGGAWDASDNGDYQIAIIANEIKDTIGTAAVAGQITTFTINI